MHDGLIVVCCVLISDVVIIVFVEVVFKSCRKDAPHVISLFKLFNLTTLNLVAGLVCMNVCFLGFFYGKLYVNIHTWCNLIQPDVDIVIPVCTGLFMVKPHSME